MRNAPPQLVGFHVQVVKPLAGGSMLWSLEPEQKNLELSFEEDEASTLAAIEELRRNPDVEYAHVDLYMEFFATPNDPLYPEQWHYPAMNLPQAWNTVTGGVKIAVLDTGRLDHPDLVGRWAPGYDFGEGDADPTDNGTWHHGLHVSGILAANTNNAMGGAGVCWGCQLMPVRISNRYDQLVTVSTVGLAVQWAADNGARVINMSFGSNGGSDPCSNYPYMQDAVNYALQRGVVLVAAAGNFMVDTAGVTPASCNGVIAVAASTRTGQLASFSNRGTRVDVTAPGGGPEFYGQGLGCPEDGSTYSGTDGAVSPWAIVKAGDQLQPTDYCYRYLSGTSMASPHVAGLAALLLTQRPSMSPWQITERIKQTARPIPGCTSDCGTGLVDAAAALYPPPPEKPMKGPWWNPARSGNGLDIQYMPNDNNTLAMSWFTYKPSGEPIWYMSYLSAGAGEWVGDLLRTSWSGTSASTQVVGTAKLIGTNGQWTYQWKLGALSGSEPIQPFLFGNGATTMEMSGDWYNPQESGWGVVFATRGTIQVATVTVYRGSEPVWMQGLVDTSATSFTIGLNYITGTNLCPGCSGAPSTVSQPAGTLSIAGAGGVPSVVTSSTQISFPGGTWNRPPFNLTRLIGP
ncbi:S8 family serine peptidase [Hyalangium gracile]|uniref:S8 family serine peptidase n=1 Tax=Hyalangium gracile TaxID=394092 RepID=UPI001CCB9BEC|nr:S8 family serine peptidase [Hyalangium gracile]